jgi:hypothetical protein
VSDVRLANLFLGSCCIILGAIDVMRTLNIDSRQSSTRRERSCRSSSVPPSAIRQSAI